MISLRGLFARLRPAGASILLLGTVSCASLPEQVPRTSIVMAHQQGWAVDPGNGFQRFKTDEYDDYINAIFRDIASHCPEKPEETLKEKPEPCKVLFFFHGGLNTRNASVSRAARMRDRILASGSYPIFVNWNSSFPSTWWDHVARVRKGIWTGNRFVALFPYFAAVDEVKSVVEAPVAWYAEARHTFPRFTADKPSVKAYMDLLRASPRRVQVNDIAAEGDVLADDRKLSQKAQSYATLAVTLPTKIVAPPLLIQAAGTGAWDIMQRRTAMLFRTEDEFRNVSPEQIAEKQAAGPSEVPQAGAALAHFITRFQKDFVPTFCREGKYPAVPGGPETTASREEQEPKIREESPTPPACKHPVEITLVGHSMGAIIVDELLRYAPNMEVKNIVFMAAATTVRDYRTTVIPYLKQHEEAKMYHLILHPVAEVSETGFLDLSPRGSLLVWIDNYFTNPITPHDRMVGRFFNLLPELLYTEPNKDKDNKDLPPKVHLKVFRVGKSLHCSNPQKHGDFGLFPFWDPRFWDPDVPQSGPAPYVRWDDPKCGSPL